MQKNIITSILTIVFMLLFSVPGPISGATQEDKMDKAVQLFKNGNYKEAEPLFQQLLENQPENPMLNYYYGSCQTENGMYKTSVLNYLLKANQDSVPAKIDYYIGIQYQAQNKWEQALRHYNKFRLKTQETEQGDLKLAEKIQQCYNHENPFLLASSLAKSGTNNANEFQEDTIQKNNPEPDSLNHKEDFTSGMPIEFRINSNVTYLNTANFRTEEGKKLFKEANVKQQELDVSLHKADELRKDYQEVSLESEKKIIGDKILSLENETYSLKDEIIQLLERSRNLENEYWQNAPEQELTDFKSEVEKLAQTVAPPKPEDDSAKVLPDTSIIIDPNILLNKIDVEKVTGEQPETDELVYKIQIGAYSKGPPRYVERLFKKLSVIRKIDHYTDENGVTVYTTGNLTNLDDAIKMQKQVRQEGVEDAFVVPYFNGKRITLKQAKEIAKEL